MEECDFFQKQKILILIGFLFIIIVWRIFLSLLLYYILL